MATPAEFLYDPCTCESGMRDGARCADCGGRGIVPKGTKPTGTAVAPDEDAELEVSDDLDQLSMTDLRGLARDRGLSAGGGRQALTTRIRAAAGEAADETADDASDDDDAENDEDDDLD